MTVYQTVIQWFKKPNEIGILGGISMYTAVSDRPISWAIHQVIAVFICVYDKGVIYRELWSHNEGL